MRGSTDNVTTPPTYQNLWAYSGTDDCSALLVRKVSLHERPISRNADFWSDNMQLIADEVIEAMPEDKREIARSLLTEVEFMAETLSRLRAHIEENGVTEWYENGRQKCWKESAALKSYNTTLKSYNGTIKQLAALLPEESGEVDALAEWLANN